MSRKHTPATLTPEWSSKIDVAQLSAKELRVPLTATEQQRRDLARRLRVQSIDAIGGDVTLHRQSGRHIVEVKGEVRATVTQACVVTLDPVVSKIVEPIEAWFSDEEQVITFSRARREREGQRGDAELELIADEDDPEPVTDGAIDIGELATQFLSLGIDPYPRSEAAKAAVLEEPAAPKRPNPFAALKDWKAGK